MNLTFIFNLSQFNKIHLMHCVKLYIVLSNNLIFIFISLVIKLFFKIKTFVFQIMN
jgi:hypothetical protein